MDLATFVDMWDKGADNFKDDPPNASLAIYEAGGDKHAVLIVSKPAVDGNDISYKVKILDEAIPASFGHATLFIDAFPCSVNNC